MKIGFTEEWKDWIRTNIAAGQHKDGLFKILLDEGFDHNAIKKEMNYEPRISPLFLVNPFDAIKQQPTTFTNHGAKLEKLYLPQAKQLHSGKIELYILENFFNQQECKKITQLINSKKQPSGLSSHETDQTFRTSSTCYLGNMNDAFTHKIDQRICDTIGIHPSYSEIIQGQHYEVGQEFKAHTDYFETNEMVTHANHMGQRTYTFMIYLNTVEEGGETAFPKLGETFKPTLGTAIIWNSLNPDGSPNVNTLHHAKPVRKGYKAIITKWFRSSSNLSPEPL
ncbi:MAG: 2OG-Fe(II) oxygenase [Thiotrichaceae bacterium]